MSGERVMDLPNAPVAHEGFFVTHFFTVKDQEKSKDFYVRILGGKVIEHENRSTLSSLTLDHSIFRWRPNAQRAGGPA
jgi:catechol-2,3-dioxygenase